MWGKLVTPTNLIPFAGKVGCCPNSLSANTLGASSEQWRMPLFSWKCMLRWVFIGDLKLAKCYWQTVFHVEERKVEEKSTAVNTACRTVLPKRCWAFLLIPMQTLIHNNTPWIYPLWAREVIIQIFTQNSNRIISKLYFSEFHRRRWHSPYFHISNTAGSKR